jgi:hypothetical protein
VRLMALVSNSRFGESSSSVSASSFPARHSGLFPYTEKMPRKRRKRGRPRTGQDPIASVRLPKKMIRNIATVAEKLGMDRSTAHRLVLEEGFNHSGLMIGLLKRGTGRGLAGQLAAAWIAEYRAEKVSQHAQRATPRRKVEMEIKALRAEEDADARTNALRDRLAVEQSRKEPSRHVETVMPPILTAKGQLPETASSDAVGR